MTIPAWFDVIQRSQQAGFAPGIAKWLRELDAIYLYGTIGAEAVLLRDGTVRQWRAENWTESDELTESVAVGLDRIMAIKLASRQNPQLEDLLPTRAADVPDCALCSGSGHMPQIEGVVCSACGGLGWVPSAI